MGNVTFILKEPTKKTETLIYLIYRYKGMRVKFSTGESIVPLNWNFKQQKAKKNSATTRNKQYELNSFLNVLSDQCEQIYHTALANGIPSPEYIRNKLAEYIKRNTKKTDSGSGASDSNLHELIHRFIQGSILTMDGKQKTLGTLKTYKSTYKHLQDFEKKKRYPLNFDTINLDFFDQFNAYLINKDISINTRAKYVKTVKVFMNEALERDLTTNMDFRRRKFNVKRVEAESVYLKEKELLKIYRHNFSKQPRLERVRDLFILGCYVGLRFSDFSRIKPEHIITNEDGLYIKIRTQKTDDLVIIPINPIVKEIMDKYDGKIPPPISNQKFNKFIKEAVSEVGLDETGRLSKQPERPLYECVSSHTARRSFATNLYLNGFPTIDIMKITGHRSEKTFLQYVKVSKEETAKRLHDFQKKDWSEKVISLVS